MSTNTVLYSYYRSSCSWRVRIALALKGIEYQYEAVNLMKDGGEHKKNEYLKKSPMGQVPLLKIDGHYLTQSLPIIEYLEETRPEPSLFPKDPVKKSKVRAVSELINSGIQPVQNLAILQYVGKDDSMKWARHWIIHGFKALEKTLEETSGKCCFDDTLTMADLFLVPQVYNAKRYGVDMKEFPVISRIDDYLLTLDAFQVAHAHCQPDTPPELRS